MVNIYAEFKEIVSLTRKYMQFYEQRGGVGLFVPQDKKNDSLGAIAEEVMNCRRCSLYNLRNKAVVGEGNTAADLMFVGEAPGYDEDKAGRPFVGKAGQLLTKIIEAIDLNRAEVYIANILKCRPPGNRNPLEPEITACRDFLWRQINVIKPKVICALGTFAAQTLLETEEKISELRGSFYDLQGIKLMPTFHPSYLLRNPQGKKKVWHDMQKVRDFLKKSI